MNSKEADIKFEAEVGKAVDLFRNKSIYDMRIKEIIRRRVVDFFETEMREDGRLLHQGLAEETQTLNLPK